VLTEHGYAGLSTRRVAEAAKTQMSQIRYHFGSKEGLILSVFQDMNHDLLDRQARMFHDSRLPLSEKWQMACDFLEDDLESEYVRVFQELIAAGWSNPAVRKEMKSGLKGWSELLAEAAEQAEAVHGRLGDFEPREIAALVSAVFLGAEEKILLGITEDEVPLRAALRKIGDLIRALEQTG
jgi:AcrR family transcriptional regulator